MVSNKTLSIEEGKAKFSLIEFYISFPKNTNIMQMRPYSIPNKIGYITFSKTDSSFAFVNANFWFLKTFPIKLILCVVEIEEFRRKILQKNRNHFVARKYVKLIEFL